MEVTSAMICAAIRKATEAGLLPRNCSKVELKDSMEIMHIILQAALDHRGIDKEHPGALPRMGEKHSAGYEY
jgi:hypothetical protein